MRRILFWLVLIGTGMRLFGIEFGGHVKSGGGASLRIGGCPLVPAVYDGKWKAHMPDNSEEDDSAVLKRRWNPADGLDFVLSRKLEPLSERELKVVYALSSEHDASPGWPV